MAGTNVASHDRAIVRRQKHFYPPGPSGFAKKELAVGPASHEQPKTQERRDRLAWLSSIIIIERRSYCLSTGWSTCSLFSSKVDLGNQFKSQKCCLVCIESE